MKLFHHLFIHWRFSNVYNIHPWFRKKYFDISNMLHNSCPGSLTIIISIKHHLESLASLCAHSEQNSSISLMLKKYSCCQHINETKFKTEKILTIFIRNFCIITFGFLVRSLSCSVLIIAMIPSRNYVRSWGIETNKKWWETQVSLTSGQKHATGAMAYVTGAGSTLSHYQLGWWYWDHRRICTSPDANSALLGVLEDELDRSIGNDQIKGQMCLKFIFSSDLHLASWWATKYAFMFA